jgi:hypothetical protein
MRIMEDNISREFGQYRKDLANELREVRSSSGNKAMRMHWRSVVKRDPKYAKNRKEKELIGWALGRKLWVNIPAEDRINDEIINEYIEKHKHPVSPEEAREIVLDGMQAIDEAYRNGLVFLGYGSPYLSLVKPGSIDWMQYDVEAIQNYEGELSKRINELWKPFEFGDLAPRVGLPWINECSGSHDYTNFKPTEFECDFGVDKEQRTNRALQLLEKFRLAPEQITEKKARLQEEAREKARQEKAREYARFDPEI